MSWNVSLNMHNSPVTVEPHEEGATIMLGGNPTAEMSVTGRT